MGWPLAFMFAAVMAAVAAMAWAPDEKECPPAQTSSRVLLASLDGLTKCCCPKESSTRCCTYQTHCGYPMGCQCK